MKPTKNLNRPLYRLTDALYGCGREEWILIRNPGIHEPKSWSTLSGPIPWIPEEI